MNFLARTAEVIMALFPVSTERVMSLASASLTAGVRSSINLSHAPRLAPILGTVVAEDDHLLAEAHGPNNLSVEGLGHVDATLQGGHVFLVDGVADLDLADQQTNKVVPRDR